jgi:hypothetical protein
MGCASGTLRHSMMLLCALLVSICAAPELAMGQSARSPEKVIIDSDIGDDVDDAFALALAVRSPEVQILGVTTAFAETEARAKIVDRFLGEVGRSDIPVFAGKAGGKTPMSQRRYGEGSKFAKSSHADAADFILEQVKKYPGEITLVAIGPLMNVGEVIDRDAATFRKLKRVVIMGGSAWIRRIWVQREGATVAGVEHSERCEVGAKVVCVGSSVVCDAAGFDAIEAGRGEARVSVHARNSGDGSADDPVSHVGAGDADLV